MNKHIQAHSLLKAYAKELGKFDPLNGPVVEKLAMLIKPGTKIIKATTESVKLQRENNIAVFDRFGRCTWEPFIPEPPKVVKSNAIAKPKSISKTKSSTSKASKRAPLTMVGGTKF